MSEKSPLETLQEDFEGATPEEAMDNLRLLMRELVLIDDDVELRLQRLESVLGLPDIEDDEGEGESSWVQMLIESAQDIQQAGAILLEHENDQAKVLGAKLSELAASLINAQGDDDEEPDAA